MKKTLFSLVLCFIMCMAFIPTLVFATDTDPDTDPDTDLEATKGDFQYTDTDPDTDPDTDLEATQGDFQYTETEDAVTITKYVGTDTDAEVIVPQTINDKPVWSIGENAFLRKGNVTSVKLPASVRVIEDGAFHQCYGLKTINLYYGLETIGANAFNHCPNLTEVKLPRSVKSIGDGAFASCFNLKKINIPAQVTRLNKDLFYDCRAIEEVTLPEGLKEIGENAFAICGNLSRIELPEGLETIENSAFSECTGISFTELPSTVKTVGNGAFSTTGITTMKLPEGLTVLEGNTFDHCRKLTSVELPEGIEVIGEYALHDCRELKSVNIPESVTSIEKSAFSYTDNLKEIELPKNLKSLGEGAFLISGITKIKVPEGIETIEADTFHECRELTEIELPSNLKTIGRTAFASCFALDEIEIPKSVVKIDESAFEGSGLKGIKLEASIDRIEKGVFKDCTSLMTITIPDGVERIEECAFQGCKGLREIKMPQSLVFIGNCAFEDCSSLASFDMPLKLKTIGERAFHDCYALADLYFSPEVETVGELAFWKCYIKDIYIRDMDHFNNEIRFGKYYSYPIIEGTKAHAPLNIDDVTFDNLDFVYDGTEHVIEPKCKMLTPEDYMYDELKVTDAGTYELVVKAANPKTCYGEQTLKFTVAKKHLKKGDVSISEMKDLTYTGKALKQVLTIKLGEQELVAGTDYKVYYDNNTSVGTALVDIDFKGNYTGSIDDLTFKILPADASDFKAALSSDSYTYTGEEKKPAVTVYDAEDSLVDDSEYDVTYSNNRDAGTATAKVVFKGNYTGSKTLEFKILPADASDFKAALSSDSYTYTGEEKKPAVTVYDAEDNIIDQSSYEVTYSNNRDAGTATAKVVFKGNYTGSKTLEFKILPAKANCTLSAKTFVYTGKEKKPAVTVCDEEGNAVDSAEYTVTYSKNKAVGTASANIAFKGNYCSDVETLNFTIKPAKASIYRLTPGTKKLTVKMSAKPSAKGATRYQLAYKQKGTSTWKYTTTSTQTKTIKSLKKGKRYYVKARAYKTVNSKKYYGSWSKVKLSSTIK